MDSQEEDKPSSSRRRKKRGRTSESDKAPKKKAKSEDVDALLEETSQSDQTRMEQAKVIDVPQPKKDQFKAKLNEIFMSEHVQVRSSVQIAIYRGGPHMVAIIFMFGTKYTCNISHKWDYICLQS